MPSPTKSVYLRPSRFTLFIALLLVFASSSLAIDLGRAFKKKDDAADDGGKKAMTSEDALANAKKLVNDLNDASTGTVTSYQPGREKEPVTCNEIMAKSMLRANEEKVAVVAEKNAVLKAAALLSEKIDDLNAQLESATEEIASLHQGLADQLVGHESAMEALNQKAKADKAEVEQIFSDARTHFEVRLQAARDDADHEREQSDQNLSHAKEIQERTKHEAEQTVLAEIEKSKRNMDALKDATDRSIAEMEKETAESIAAKDKQLAAKMEEAEQKVITIEADARDQIIKSQKNADDKVASLMNGAEKQRHVLLEHTQKQVEDAKGEAEQKVDRMKVELADQKDVHQNEIAELKAEQMKKMKEIEELKNKEVQEAHDAMYTAISKANAKIEEEKEANEKKVQEVKEMMDTAVAKTSVKIAEEKEANMKLQVKLKQKSEEADNKESSLRNDLKLQRSESFKLEKDVSFWKEAHEHQGYCNTTLIREDSRRLISNAFEGASRGLDSGHKVLAAGLGSQLELVQKTGADVMLFIENELLPSIQKVIGEGYDKCMALYDQHLAAAVNENVLPFYNQNILPAYQQHLSPVVKTIEGEAAVAMHKSREGINMVRSKSATVVQKSADNLMEIMEDHKIDRKLPGWLYSFIDECSSDGEWAVDKITKGLLVLIGILCRSIIYRMIGAIFSLIWFFCPLRFFVGGGRPKTVENRGAREGSNSSTTKKRDMPQSTKSKTNGKAKVY